MSEESVAFEQLNAKIEQLRRTRDAKVTWNPKDFVDPDSPSETRQIDVLIEEGGRRTGVECRAHKAEQNVKWVEELIGRKQSLQLDAIIGVSLTGFTPLARLKGQRYGVILYDFEELTDQEVASWANAATVEAKFIQFDLTIVAVIATADAPNVPAQPDFKHGQQDGYGAVMQMIREDAASHQGTTREMDLPVKDFSVNGFRLVHLRAGYTSRIVSSSAKCSAVSVRGYAGTHVSLRDVTVQKFEHTVQQVVRKQDDVHIVLDVSKLTPPPDSILHEMEIRFPSEVTVREYELVGSRVIQTKGENTMLMVLPLAIFGR